MYRQTWEKSSTSRNNNNITELMIQANKLTIEYTPTPQRLEAFADTVHTPSSRFKNNNNNLKNGLDNDFNNNFNRTFSNNFTNNNISSFSSFNNSNENKNTNNFNNVNFNILNKNKSNFDINYLSPIHINKDNNYSPKLLSRVHEYPSQEHTSISASVDVSQSFLNIPELELDPVPILNNQNNYNYSNQNNQNLFALTSPLSPNSSLQVPTIKNAALKSIPNKFGSKNKIVPLNLVSRNNPNPPSPHSIPVSSRTYLKVQQMEKFLGKRMILFVMSYMICCLPAGLISFCQIWTNSIFIETNPIFYLVAAHLIHLQPIINSLIYIWINSSVQTSIKQWIYRYLLICKRSLLSKDLIVIFTAKIIMLRRILIM